MSKITVIFTKRRFGVVSLLVRWVLPRSRFSLALSSHCYIIDKDEIHVYDTLPSTGVRRTKIHEALKGDTIVFKKEYKVPDANAGYLFLNKQLGKPYDLKAALSIGLKPKRKWNNGDKWICYSLAAGTLIAAGLHVFSDITHIGETSLLGIDT